ncbi:site-specific integrase [Coleofasciculus sp. FACHB-1120]|uniref:site-specific integrase n=1 Tax=Coleofasciculus sp. FACHB-1120 TaxID=2692783 RepID=UPI001682C690|nr:site-specific integrase [Coleofasciculus sp. FACHB-1120]MBD2743688.1 site-specific integrase [Coleofasciculus sp. FACHB-1120]
MIEKLAQANGRLKAAKVGAKIEIKGNRLYLRATFPPKSSSSKQIPYQQRLALGIHANPTGLSEAEKEARKIGALLDCKEFSWEPYLKASAERENANTVADWTLRFEADYFHRRRRSDKSESTWKGDYLKVLRQLPQDELLSVDLLKTLVLATTPDSKSRKRVCMVANALAKFAGLDYDFRPYAGRYSPRRVSPRDLPDDLKIAQTWSAIKNPAWRWVCGVIATYGLRPHEAFHLDYNEIKAGSQVISVLGGKTGARRVWPCYPEWHDQFEIEQVRLPNIDLDRSNTRIGESCSKYLNPRLPGFKLYDLRHCWAVRTLEFGLDLTLAAQQMGHSVQVHTDTYHHWITDKHHQKAFEALMLRSDRPKAPVLGLNQQAFRQQID